MNTEGFKNKRWGKSKSVIVMKFGGSSVGTGKRMLHIAQTVKQFNREKEVVVVVSAMHGVTDKLISLFQRYKAKEFEEAITEIQVLHRIHKHALDELKLNKKEYCRIEKSILDLFGQLSVYLALHHRYVASDYDYVISFGERLSSYLVASAIKKYGINAEAVDGSDVIVANNEFTNAKVLLVETKVKARKFLTDLLSKKVVPVITGFFAGTKQGAIITLGRGGSDYSATVLAYALDAQEVILWKEVDGVFAQDPKQNNKAKLYLELSYKQAMALARKGAKVLHPEAIRPVASKGIVVWVRNIFRPDFTGTKIWQGVL